MSVLKSVVCISAGLVAFCLPPRAKADDWDQKTTVTFSQPVEIPGKVLPAGTYVFKLADSQSDRNVVEVFNKDENHLYGIFLAIPDYRMKTPEKPIITFEERVVGAPEAVKAWFYPGDNYGHDFVYPKAKAVALAKVNHQPVPSMPNELAANTVQPTTSMNQPHVMALKKAPLKAQQPTEETTIAEAFPPPPPPASAPPAAKMPATLPQTASPLPLIGLLGLLSLGTAGWLRLMAARMK